MVKDEAKAVLPDTSKRLAEVGVADWMIDRLSGASLERLAALAAEGAGARTHYGSVGLDELRAAGVANRVTSSAPGANNLQPTEFAPTRSFLSTSFGVNAHCTLPKDYWDGVVNSVSSGASIVPRSRPSLTTGIQTTRFRLIEPLPNTRNSIQRSQKR